MAEYTILIALVIIGVTMMGVYVQRGLQGRYHDAVRAAQKAANASQYEPVAVSSSLDQKYKDRTYLRMFRGGARARTEKSDTTATFTQDIKLEKDTQ